MADLLECHLATADDDAYLRPFVESLSDSGAIETGIRYPSGFLAACRVMGSEAQVIVVRRQGELVALGSRIPRACFINGRITDTAYLGDLRVAPKCRRGLALARGFRYLRQLDAAQKCHAYCTVINEANLTAVSTLTSGKAGLPHYIDLGRLNTYLITVAEQPRPVRSVEGGSKAVLPEIVDCLNRNQLQFSQTYNCDVFHTFKGLELTDIYFIRRAKSITSVLAQWDQRSFRELVITKYPPILEALRQAIDGAGSTWFPSLNATLPLTYLAFISTEDDADFESLVEHACFKAWERGIKGLIISLHERDPRCKVLARYETTQSFLRLYAVAFDSVPSLDDRIPYLEAAFIC